MEYNTLAIKNCGAVCAKFSDAELLPIKTEISNIQKNFDLYKTQKYNKHLAGNIKREYLLVESKKYIEKLLIPLVVAYDENYEYIKNLNILTTNVPVVLDQCWVNFQKKYEFNPPHNHTGIFSFVIWINVPYDIKEEHELSPGMESNANKAGGFSFLFTDTIGGIRTYDISIDKNCENTMVLFPSKFYHMVYPFFSSDGYRISVSGNFKFKTG